MATQTRRGKKRWFLLFGPWLVGEQDSDGEVRGFCLYHDDSNPSMFYNMEMEVAHCKSCNAGRNFYTMKTDIEGGDVYRPSSVNRERAREELSKKVQWESPQDLTIEMVEGWHDNLLENQGAFLWLVRDKGLFDVTIYDSLIGYELETHRYTIPIFDEDGKLVNVRRYQSDATGSDKMWNWPGRGSPARLYPIENLLSNDEIVVTEGEWDALVASQYGVPAVSGTGGAMQWRDEWNNLFTGKTVCFIYDADDAGRKGAYAAAKSIEDYAESVSVTEVPLEKPGADISDLFSFETGAGWTVEGLVDLISTAKPIMNFSEDPNEEIDGDKAEAVDEYDVKSSYLVSKGVYDLRGVVVGRVDPPLIMPSKAELKCNQDAGNKCMFCPMSRKWNGSHTEEISPQNESVLETTLDGRRSPEKAIQESVGIPTSCKKVDIKTSEFRSVDRIVVQDPVTRASFHDLKQGNNFERIVYVTESRDLMSEGESIILRGKSMRHPTSSENVMLAWNMRTINTSIDSYKMTPSKREMLERFQPQDDQSPLDKMYEIAADLASNVTRIANRDNIHIAFDLVAHSVIEFGLNKKSVGRGWLDAVVIGDTRTGKTAVSEALVNHYGMGALFSCEGVSMAGLIGAAVKYRGRGSRWSIRWGAIPMNDRKMVVLDEASGLIRGLGKYKNNMFSELSSVRDSGIAQITKAASASRLARTRKLWLSNPVSALSVGGLGSGVRALNELIDQPEDIARFDYALVIVDEPFETSLPQVPQKVTAQASSELIRWVWSRTASQVIWEEEAERMTQELGQRVSKEFSGSSVPLIQSSNAYVKIARIAVAIAARTFSADETGECILVEKRHVKSAVDWLYTAYMDKHFGYFQDSEKGLYQDRRFEENREKIEGVLRKDTSLLLMFYEKALFRERDVREASRNSGWHHRDYGSPVMTLPLLIDLGAVLPQSHGEMFQLTTNMRQMVRQMVEEMR